MASLKFSFFFCNKKTKYPQTHSYFKNHYLIKIYCYLITEYSGVKITQKT